MKTSKIKNTDKEFNRLLERVIILKDNLFGFGNWKKSYLPTDIEGCKSYINYCKREYNIIG